MSRNMEVNIDKQAANKNTIYYFQTLQSMSGKVINFGAGPGELPEEVKNYNKKKTYNQISQITVLVKSICFPKLTQLLSYL